METLEHCEGRISARQKNNCVRVIYNEIEFKWSIRSVLLCTPVIRHHKIRNIILEISLIIIFFQSHYLELTLFNIYRNHVDGCNRRTSNGSQMVQSVNNQMSHESEHAHINTYLYKVYPLKVIVIYTFPECIILSQ